MKNHFVFVNDHSGSMSGGKAQAAIKDYNNTITAVKDASSREQQDTIVSVVGIGYPSGSQVTRQVVISNPHVLKPVSAWSVQGGTPLWDGIGNAIELIESLPDYNNPDLSIVVSVTTDGEEMDSRRYSNGHRVGRINLSEKIRQLQSTGRWTFVVRVPTGYRRNLDGLNIPSDNIQEWDNSAAGLERSTAQTVAAVGSFFAARTAGSRSSNTFYTSVAAVDTSKLVDISKETSLYIVDDSQAGMWIKDFILTKRMEYLVGAAFYQLTKSEPRVSPTKLILIRDKKTGQVFAGSDARAQLGLDTVNNARINPNHGNGNYDIFIQSESVNRKLVPKSGVLYWAAKGRKMTQADLDKYAPKAAPVVPAVPVLAPAPATGRPTPSPVSVSAMGPTLNGKRVRIFEKRDDARKVGSVIDLRDPRFAVAPKTGINPRDRWVVYA